MRSSSLVIAFQKLLMKYILIFLNLKYFKNFLMKFEVKLYFLNGKKI